MGDKSAENIKGETWITWNPAAQAHKTSNTTHELDNSLDWSSYS